MELNVYLKIGRTSKSEIRSWNHSLQRMSNVLRNRDILNTGYILRSTGGLLKEIMLDKNIVCLTFSLFLEEAFFATSSFSINTMLENLKTLHDNGEQLIVTCVGEVVLREEQLGMLIMDENKLIFNRLYLSELLLSKNTLF